MEPTSAGGCPRDSAESENFDRESGPITDLISKQNQIKPQAYRSASDIYKTVLSIHQMTHRRC